MDLLVSGEDGDKLILHFYGKLDDSLKSSFEEHKVAFSKHSTLEFDLSGVEEFEDIAVLHWIRFLDTLPKNYRLFYSKCSPACVLTFNSVPELVKRVEVRSVIFAARCRLCSNDFTVEIEKEGLSKVETTIGNAHCEKCFAKDFEAIEAPSIYFSFLKHSKH